MYCTDYCTVGTQYSMIDGPIGSFVLRAYSISAMCAPDAVNTHGFVWMFSCTI